MPFTVQVASDDTHHRYYVLSSDIPGLNVETSSFDELMEITTDMLPDLLGERATGSRVIFQREVQFTG